MHRIATLFAAALFVMSGTACVIIEDGEVGVLKSFGKISDDPVGPGVSLVLPVARQIETWNIKRQELKESAEMPSSEGLIVGLETSLQFRLVAERAPQVRTTIGRDYRGILIVPYFRSQIRDVVAAYEVSEIYSQEGRVKIAEQVHEGLTNSLGPEGIDVLAVLLRDVRLPQRFKEAIEAKLTADQRVEQKGFELEQAKKDAEIEIARAKGAARAQEIVRSTLSSSYLHYLWIKTLNENPNVIYVSTENNVPIFKTIK